MAENIITSRKHILIKQAVSIINSSAKREELGLFMAEGARICEDAVNSKTEILYFFYTENAYKKYKKYIDKCIEVSNEVYIISESVSQVLADTKNPQGVFALCKIKENQEKIDGKVLVLEKVQDPTNVGTVFRTAEALGIETIIMLGDCCDVYSPKVIRSTMGAIFRVNVMKIQELEILLSKLKKLKYECFAAVVNEMARKVNTISFTQKTAVFIGNEGNGLTNECISKMQNITIPMRGNAESLNASVAASIIMWELLRDV